MMEDEALKAQFEAWFESQYKRKPCPNVKANDEPHDSTYMTMFADGAWKGWLAAYKIYGE